MNQFATRPQTAGSLIESNKVLRNTYWLLALTLAFSALCAFAAAQLNVPPLQPWWLMLVGFFGLLFLTHALRNSAWGILAVFALTGFLGFTMGARLNIISAAFSNGNELIMLAFGGTAGIFFLMSGIGAFSKRDFGFLGKFLAIGVMVAFLGAIGAVVFELPALMLAVAGAFVVLSSLIIMWETQQIVNGGETNYISATVTLYVSIYNLFSSLLHLLMAFAGEE